MSKLTIELTPQEIVQISELLKVSKEDFEGAYKGKATEYAKRILLTRKILGFAMERDCIDPELINLADS